MHRISSVDVETTERRKPKLHRTCVVLRKQSGFPNPRPDSHKDINDHNKTHSHSSNDQHRVLHIVSLLHVKVHGRPHHFLSSNVFHHALTSLGYWEGRAVAFVRGTFYFVDFHD
ncbi:hypothetical protein QCA50_004994 [Cerrena zonata]|uniref:Uncharacterized protein n=1 Tax=Cerrena zonata TaxID=2478898 RepID=A0AAW0GKG4_9APHY